MKETICELKSNPDQNNFQANFHLYFDTTFYFRCTQTNISNQKPPQPSKNNKTKNHNTQTHIQTNK